MKTITTITKVYELSELSPAAKIKAREDYRKANQEDNFYAELTIDDAKNVFAHCGVSIDRVFFSGFWSQGDGACFEGSWHASDVKPGAMKADASEDKELHRIAAEFEGIAKMFPLASFTVKHRGHYQHENCTDFSFSFPDENGDETDGQGTTQAEADLTEAAKDAMRWIYRQLEKEYDYQNSDEQIDETMECNGYTFTEEGERFG